MQPDYSHIEAFPAALLTGWLVAVPIRKLVPI